MYRYIEGGQHYYQKLSETIPVQQKRSIDEKKIVDYLA